MSKAKTKGRRLENEVVDALESKGIKCRRMPNSGAFMNDLRDDIVIGSIEDPWKRGECKYRESFMRALWDWLIGKVDFLVIRRNRYPALVIITLDNYMDLLLKDTNCPKLEVNLTPMSDEKGDVYGATRQG